MSAIWEYLVKLSIVGNAVLLVLLLGGSHPSSQMGIWPHKPVHMVRNLDTLTSQSWITAIHDSQGNWDAATGYNILYYWGPWAGQVTDAVIIDLPPGGEQDVPFCPHDTDGLPCPWYAIADFDCDSPCNVLGRVLTFPLDLDSAMKVVILNQSLVPPLAQKERVRLVKHELGHVLSLGDHDDEYNGIMDGHCALPGCTQDDPIYDYIIWDLPDEPDVADEASCVRELFNIFGKQRCD